MPKNPIVQFVLWLTLGGVLFGVAASGLVQTDDDKFVVAEPPQKEVGEPTVVTADSARTDGVSERYRAHIDRVTVVFEHYDDATYRLQTNDLVRSGELRTERGYGNDPDATVYILNWQQSPGAQLRFLRRSAEPQFLYSLDAGGAILWGSKLTADPN